MNSWRWRAQRRPGAGLTPGLGFGLPWPAHAAPPRGSHGERRASALEVSGEEHVVAPCGRCRAAVTPPPRPLLPYPPRPLLPYPLCPPLQSPIPSLPMPHVRSSPSQARQEIGLVVEIQLGKHHLDAVGRGHRFDVYLCHSCPIQVRPDSVAIRE